MEPVVYETCIDALFGEGYIEGMLCNHLFVTISSPRTDKSNRSAIIVISLFGSPPLVNSSWRTLKSFLPRPAAPSRPLLSLHTDDSRYRLCPSHSQSNKYPLCKSRDYHRPRRRPTPSSSSNSNNNAPYSTISTPCSSSPTPILKTSYSPKPY